MNEKSIYIKNGQRLSDVYSIIEPNTILCKFLTGIGATHLEITAPRHSILIEPNIPPIKGKCANPQYKSYNLFGVIQKVSIDDVSNYLDKTLRSKKYIKILTTPESFSKVKAAFEDCGIDLYSTCFLLMDECHKFIQDVDYRENITLPVDDFFCFNNKAFVSATPIIPSDPRFDEQRFTFVKVMPNYIKGRPLTEVYHFPDKATEELYKDMTTTVGIPLTELNHEKLKVTQVYTNNVLEAVKKWIKIKEDMLPSVKTLLGQQLGQMGAVADSNGNYSIPVDRDLTLNVGFKGDYLYVSNSVMPDKTFASSSNAGKFSGKTGVIYVDMPKGSILASAATMVTGVDLSGYFYAWSDDEQSEAVLHIDDNPESNILKLIIKTVDGMSR